MSKPSSPRHQQLHHPPNVDLIQQMAVRGQSMRNSKRMEEEETVNQDKKIASLKHYYFKGNPGALSGKSTLKANKNVADSVLRSFYHSEPTVRRLYGVPKKNKKQDLHHMRAAFPLSRIQLDLIDFTQDVSTYKYGLMAVCCFSKFTQVIPINNKSFPEMEKAMTKLWKVLKKFEVFPSQRSHLYLTDAGNGWCKPT